MKNSPHRKMIEIAPNQTNLLIGSNINISVSVAPFYFFFTPLSNNNYSVEINKFFDGNGKPKRIYASCG